MGISPGIIMLILNLLFLLIVVLAFLGGLIKGLYKSLIFLGFSALFFLIGFFVIPSISNKLLSMDVSSLLGQFIPEVEITSIKESLPDILSHYLPEFADIFLPGSEIVAVAYGTVKMVLNIVLLIVLLILNATILKIFPLILWLFIRPKKKTHELTQEVIKPNKHRWFGGLVGAVKGVMALLLIAIPFAGISSLASSAEEFLAIIPEEEPVAYVELYSDDGFEIEEIIDYLTAYRKTAAGFIFGIPFKEHRLDERVFDKIIEIEVKTESSREKIHLRRDVKKISNILKIVNEANEYSDQLEPTIVFNFEDEDFEKIKKELKGLSLLSVAKNVGVEFGYQIIENEKLNVGYEDILSLEELKKFDLFEDLDKLFDVVKIFSNSEAGKYVLEHGLPETEEEIQIVLNKVEKEEIQLAVDKLIELNTLKLGLPIAFNLALATEEIKEIIIEADIDVDTLHRPSQEDLLGLVKGTGYLGSIILEMNEGSIVFDENFLGKITEDYLDEIEAVMKDMTIFQTIQDISAEIEYKLIVENNLNEGYEDILTLEAFQNIDVSEEIATTFDVYRIVVRAGFFDHILNNGFPETEEEMENLLNVFDKEEVQLIVDKTIELQALKLSLPLAVNILLNDEDIKKSLEELEMDISSVTRPTQDDLLGLVKGIGYLASIALEANEGSLKFDKEFLFMFSDDHLDEIQDVISEMTIIEVIKEFGAEYAYNFIIKNGLEKDYEDDITEEKINEIDLREEIILFIDVLRMINAAEGQDELLNNPLALSKEEVEEVLSKISESKLVQLGLPLGVNFLLSLEQVEQIMVDNNITMDDITKPTKQELIDDFKKFVDVYDLIKDMGFNHLEDFDNIDQEFIIAIEDELVIRLFDVLFNFSIIDNNKDFVAALAYDKGTESLPDEYKDIISKQSLVDNFNAHELSTITLLVKLLFEEDLFKENTPIDYEVVLRDDNIDTISTYISESNILSEAVYGLLQVFTNELEDFTIEIPEGYSFKGEAGKNELVPLLTSARDILVLGLIEEGFDFGTLDEETLRSLAFNFSSSDIIRYNLSPMINQITAQTEFNYITSDEGPEFWTEDEIYYTLNAVKIFMTEDLNANNMHKLSPELIGEVTLSKTISNALEKFLISENGPGGMLDNQLIIPEGITYYSTEDEYGEIYYMFIGVQELLGDGPLEDFNPTPDVLVSLDFRKMFDSKILEATIVEKHLKPMFDDDHLQNYLVSSYEDGEDYDWYKDVNPLNPKGDAILLVEALLVLDEIGVGYQTMNYLGFLTVLEHNPDCIQILNDAMISSAVMNASLPKMLNQLINNEAGLNLIIKEGYKKEDLSYWGELGVNKEFYNLLQGLTIADMLDDFDYSIIDSSNKEEYKTNFKKLSGSEILIQMLPRMLDESNLSAADSLRSDKDPYELTQQEWDNEIDILVDVMVILNENPSLDIESPGFEDIPILLEIRALIINSLLYDASKVTV